MEKQDLVRFSTDLAEPLATAHVDLANALILSTEILACRSKNDSVAPQPLPSMPASRVATRPHPKSAVALILKEFTP